MFDFHKLDRLLDGFTELGIPGFDLCVHYRGREIYRRMEGCSDEAGATPMNGRESVYLYSCSKPITAVAAMQLCEQGLLTLDDKLSDIMPEFKDMNVYEDGILRPAVGEITVRELLSMSAGFSYQLESPQLQAVRADTYGICPTRTVMKYLAREPLCFDPGKRYQYSLCHDVLAAVVEVVSGKLFSEYVNEKIFAPLGMEHSSFHPSAEQLSGLMAQYEYDRERKIYTSIGAQNKFCLGSDYESGGAGCVSTLNDCMLFLDAMLQDGVLLRRETVKLMTVDGLRETDREAYPNMAFGYGYGLGVRCERAHSGAVDFGWGGAAGALMVCDPVYNFTAYYSQHVLSEVV